MWGSSEEEKLVIQGKLGSSLGLLVALLKDFRNGLKSTRTILLGSERQTQVQAGIKAQECLEEEDGGEEEKAMPVKLA